MKRSLGSLFVVLMLLALWGPALAQKFPDRPVTILVYLAPGGAGDVFARRFMKAAGQFTDAQFVVVNKPGAGGVVALTGVASGKADGYTLAYVTKSNIAKFAESKAKIKIEDFHWFANMVSDPECLIVNKRGPVRTLEQIVADAKAKKGDQLWLGPATGGNDHIMARKTWRALGIQGKWVPFESGEAAMTALMGNHGVVYVGNPQDVKGRPDLEVVVISAPKRLGGEFANVPTFKELGVAGLDEEIMWRGFALKKGTPKPAMDFYDTLITKVSSEPQWRRHIEEEGATPVFYKEDKFTAIVKEDFKDFSEVLKELAAPKSK
jgi:tripartite-type tricarboxylate transporter receptor subunit TctC